MRRASLAMTPDEKEAEQENLGGSRASMAMTPDEKETAQEDLGGLASCWWRDKRSPVFTPTSTRAPSPRQLGDLGTSTSSSLTGPPPSWVPGIRRQAEESLSSTRLSNRRSSIIAP